MSTDLHEQIRSHFRALDEAQLPVSVDEVVERIEGVVDPAPPPRRARLRPVLVAVAQAAVVALVGLLIMVSVGGEDAPPATEPVPDPNQPESNTTLPGTSRVEEVVSYETVLGTVTWEKLVVGDPWSTPDALIDGFISADPRGGLVAMGTDGVWRSVDGAQWSQTNVSVFRSDSWGDYAWYEETEADGTSRAAFGTVASGVWEEIDLPRPDGADGVVRVDSVAESGGVVVIGGAYGSVSALWRVDGVGAFEIVDGPWASPVEVFLLPGGGFGSVVADATLDDWVAGSSIWTSPDGVSWRDAGRPGWVEGSGADVVTWWTVDERGGRLFGRVWDGNGALSNPVIEWVSDDGIAWTRHETPFRLAQLAGRPTITEIGGGFVAEQNQDTLRVSADGLTWERLPDPNWGEPGNPGSGTLRGPVNRAVAGDVMLVVFDDYPDDAPNGERVLWRGRFTGAPQATDSTTSTLGEGSTARPTPLGRLTWQKVTGDARTLPIGIQADPRGGYVAFDQTGLGIWRSADAVTWDRVSESESTDSYFLSSWWGDYAAFVEVIEGVQTSGFGSLTSGEWSEIELPAPDGRTDSPFYGGVATSGATTLVWGSYPLGDDIEPALWVADGDSPFELVEDGLPLWFSGPSSVFAYPGGGFGASVSGQRTALWASPDGRSWTEEELPDWLQSVDPTTIEWWRITNRGGRLYGELTYRGPSGELGDYEEWVSDDGLVWTPSDGPFTRPPMVSQLTVGTITEPLLGGVAGGVRGLFALDADGTWDRLPFPPGQYEPEGAGVAGMGATGDIVYYEYSEATGERVLWIGRFEK